MAVPRMSSPRLDSLTSWYAEWRGLRVAVLGLSVTGFSVADTLAELGAEVLVVTEKAAEEYARLLPVIGAGLHVGPLDAPPAELVDFAPEVVIASPGFPPSHPVIRWTEENGIA
ncbi:MAG: UDP-N-acetylmuramoyl-L-alanine--D-glutamate ligase, partial [Actinobacteria bacterium]|nr:UDP-N-acetylmuramoyl-L-alanine--D-glutamate ligase [Actinomycetota bacterium]